jgi:hypothetical protein
MDDFIQPQREVLMAPCPQRKVSDDQWTAIRSLAEQGVEYKEIGSQFGCSGDTIRKRAWQEKWNTPTRVLKAQKGTLSEDDPAMAVAALWNSRSSHLRETVHNGGLKALERFYALSPVPQSFAEAATALKMVNDAINPNGTPSESTKNVSISILAGKNFSPQPVVDV